MITSQYLNSVSTTTIMQNDYPMDGKHVWSWEVKSAVEELRRPKETAKFYGISMKTLRLMLKDKIKKVKIGKNSLCYEEC